MPERLQKILSQWGVASRRSAEVLILDGRVRLNGTVAELGQKADPAYDQIEVDGKLIQPVNRPDLIYLLLNKPLGVLSTCADPQGRTIVLDLLPKSLRQSQGIHPVGRLDADSTGALLLTNDGDLTFNLTHPRHHVPKTYEVWVKGQPSNDVLSQWRKGVILDGQITLPAKVVVLKRTSSKVLLEVVLIEGRNRQIRRVAEILGHPVLKLHRVSIGSVRLAPETTGIASLQPGMYRSLSTLEIDDLKSRIGLKPLRCVAR
ncbi:rRNA pseudouridine synthase [filamentous cyanobacterium LEGE 11480]|uniref:Pseudouridine synthase n=1 Tax=Romeriopsis navalis LEGE 11480 TaxID=2777977 RepID=A0A928VH80_9CYAN|nr:pseudouridine synthase [Romeriopsis navalis]MBE9028275.1 rRNA pseudouridine synthase [Romeriopsis navalis LEGE 11480]